MIVANGNTLLGQLFLNHVNMPLLFATLLEHKLHHEKLCDIILPSELHGILGIMNHTLHEFGKIWRKLVKDWVKHVR